VNFPVQLLPPDVQATATTLSDELGRDLPRVRLLQAFLRNFELLFETLRRGPEAVLDAWRVLPNTLGLRVRAQLWEGIAEGVAVALLDDGALLLRSDSGEEVRITTGDVLHAPVAMEDAA
jgi:BirA family biotin operon repressor/biotin-[acetyl-CoA-carboxylase] ligase